MATLRSCGGRSFTTRSPIRSVPLVTCSSPASNRSSVDFPQPDGPTNTISSPSAIRSVQSTMARVPSGKVLSMCSKSTLAIT